MHNLLPRHGCRLIPDILLAFGKIKTFHWPFADRMERAPIIGGYLLSNRGCPISISNSVSSCQPGENHKKCFDSFFLLIYFPWHIQKNQSEWLVLPIN